MVFLIQNTQNKDAEAMHIKLDELIRALDKAQNALLNLEELEEPELDRIRTDYLKLAENARRELRSAPVNERRDETKRSQAVRTGSMRRRSVNDRTPAIARARGHRPGLFDRAWTDRFNAAACYCTCNRNGSW